MLRHNLPTFGWQWTETARPQHPLQIDSSRNTKESGCNTGTFQLTNTKDTNALDVAILPGKTGPVDETQHGFRTLKKTKILTQC